MQITSPVFTSKPNLFKRPKCLLNNAFKWSKEVDTSPIQSVSKHRIEYILYYSFLILITVIIEIHFTKNAVGTPKNLTKNAVGTPKNLTKNAVDD